MIVPIAESAIPVDSLSGLLRITNPITWMMRPGTPRARLMLLSRAIKGSPHGWDGRATSGQRTASLSQAGPAAATPDHLLLSSTLAIRDCPESPSRESNFPVRPTSVGQTGEIREILTG